MAPRKEAKSSVSSKPPLPFATARKNAAPRHESSAAGKKRKAAAPPPLPAPAAPAPTTVYVLMKSEGFVNCGFDSDDTRMYSIVEGVYYSEDQAYAAAIRKLISGYETQGEEPGLRDIATSKGLPLKERMKKTRAAAIRSLRRSDDAEARNLSITFRVKKTQLFPAENVDDDRLLDGLVPHPSDSDYQTDHAAAPSSPDDWDDAVSSSSSDSWWGWV